ncbi:hypothetical protein BD311DRAFT_699048 [Dichomitus squalens]|uniref:Uncharacterized protein n=1 Tax=Dichomitus squalens TaxID=114155 RepID=A0A4Q9MHP5_9APHY|nr:hypothetical protein BD311DRAFT_699048 [Dichomitus squalens]
MALNVSPQPQVQKRPQWPIIRDTVITPVHVYAVHDMLSGLGLPTELVLYIVELAEYSPVVRTKRNEYDSVIVHARVERSAARLYILCPPLPETLDGRRVRKIVWTIKGGDFSDEGSPRPWQHLRERSWYDASIFRQIELGPDRKDVTAAGGLYDVYQSPEELWQKIRDVGWTLVPNGESCVWRIQTNTIGQRPAEPYIIEWTRHQEADATQAMGCSTGGGASFIEALQPGDRIGLWMRVVSPGWGNYDVNNYVISGSLEIVYGGC